MQMIKKGIAFAFILGLIIPSVLLLTVKKMNKRTETKKPQIEAESLQSTEETKLIKSSEPTLYLSVEMSDGKNETMEIDDYITGVVLAEMPAQFHIEALKAQAVVARTYTLKRYFAEEKPKGHIVCTDSSCCQAYCSYEDFISKGGTKSQFDKVADAVKQTHGEVLTYNTELAEATYFSCSGGRTEDAQAVWGTDVPYLRSVESPGEENAAYYLDTVFFTLQEFAECMQLNNDALVGHWIGDISYTNGGGVENITICNQKYTGTQIRNLLGLRSTAFVITSVGNTVTVTTKGFGHRVGMSQYGADAMAVSGSNYQEILSYYYQGTVLEEIVI